MKVYQVFDFSQPADKMKILQKMLLSYYIRMLSPQRLGAAVLGIWLPFAVYRFLKKHIKHELLRYHCPVRNAADLHDAVSSDAGRQCADNGPPQDHWVGRPGMTGGQ